MGVMEFLDSVEGQLLVMGIAILALAVFAAWVGSNPKYRVKSHQQPRSVEQRKLPSGSSSSHTQITPRERRSPTHYDWDADRRRRADSGSDPLFVTHFGASDHSRDVSHSHHSDHSSGDWGSGDSGGDSGGGDGGGGD